MRLILALLCFIVATPAAALELTLSGAQQVASSRTDAGSVRLPDGPWVDGALSPQIEGAVRRTVLRTSRGTRTTLQLMTPLRDQLVSDGFEKLFACADKACGGFDFRFQLDLIGEPDMHVDLADYRYLLMQRDDGDPSYVSIVTSRSANAGFVHITEVGEAAPPDAESGDIEEAPNPLIDVPEDTEDVTVFLVREGYAILRDLAFLSGSATLDPGPSTDLTALAAWMLNTPGSRIALVGHSDNVGSATANRALSRRRAEAVRARLIESHGIAGDRIEADGVGYLSPIAPNTTEAGRAENRRVEAVLLSGG